MYSVIRAAFAVMFASSVAGCGQNPAFTEQKADDLASSGGTQGSGDASPGDGSSSSESTGGATDGSASPPYTPPAGYPAGTQKSDVLVEDGGTLSLPGSKAVKVGINFEDHTDMDHNDSVLCFTGDFKIENRKILSYKKQVIKAAIYSSAACVHTVQVQIFHTNGVTDSFTYNDHTTPSVNLNFDVGSQLYVTMRNVSGGCQGTFNLDNTKMVQVIPNVCKR